MKFSDFFVPKYVHSDPNVRIKFIETTTDLKLLESIVKNDKDENVISAARDRIQAVAVVTHSE